MKIFVSVTVAFVAVVLTAYIYFFGGPFFFVDRDIRRDSVEHLHADAIHAQTPKDAALSYYSYGIDPSDAPNVAKLDIHVSNPISNKSVVTIIDRDCQDDSIYVTCDRFTLHREENIWIPDRHQAAWQGRGRFG